MIEPKFTPGPWRQEDGEFKTKTIVNAGGGTVAMFVCPDDAQLIEVAPKLYEAASKAWNCLDDLPAPKSPKLKMAKREVMDALRVAIYKARGEE